MRNRILRLLSLPLLVSLGLAAVSCGGGGGGAGDLVLVSFNLPNIAGVALNQPLIYTFSSDIDESSVTPDTLQVTGSSTFTFETIVVDGNLAAELPFVPNFEDYSDSGMAPGVTYSVFLPIFPAVDTVRSKEGKALVKADAFSFTTTPSFTFIEPRRPIRHGPGPLSSPPGRFDDDGCLQNADNSLYTYPGFQFGTGPDARLLCIKNEGSPHVIPEGCTPAFDARAVGTPSAVQPGTLDLPAVRVHFNEPLDPASVAPWSSITQFAANIQLWRVGDLDAIPVTPVEIKTNKPLVIQSSQSTEIILVASGPQQQGTYVVNLTGLKDLPGNPLVITDAPDPALGGYAAIDTFIQGKVGPGYRIYWRTLQIPATAGSLTESFANNFDERTTQTFTFTTPSPGSPPSGPGDPDTNISPSPATGASGFTFVGSNPGQSTTANWNGTNRFLGLSTLKENTAQDDGAGRLKAVFEPYLGNGDDGALTVSGTATLSSGGGDANGDGIWEFTSLTVTSGAVLKLTGPKPVLILVRGNVDIQGTVDASGAGGGFGIDTDGTSRYTSSSAILDGGAGGAGGPGGGAGGAGGPKLTGNFPGDAAPGSAGMNLFGQGVSTGIGGAGGFADNTNGGGGGGGYGTAGVAGGGTSGGAAGATSLDATFSKALNTFTPERCYQPCGNLAGGAGGGGGGVQDDNGASATGDGQILVTATGQLAGGDDGGAGGGGAGGGLWIVAKSIHLASSGSILAVGGKGGNTYAAADQVGNPVSGVVDPTATGTGAGGAGGGGSGGAILLQARDGIAIDSGATLDARGGSGGTAAGGKNGGAGGNGRIALMSMAATSEAPAGSAPVTTGAVINPTPGVSDNTTWMPTVDLTSQGVTTWFNMITNTATFSTPFWSDNFSILTGAGLQKGPGLDFDAVLEYQGADSLSPDPTTPTSATGLTAWTTNLTSLNGKIFVRWRWRFYVARTDGNPANDPDFDPAADPMPAILDFTLPFTK